MLVDRRRRPCSDLNVRRAQARLAKDPSPKWAHRHSQSRNASGGFDRRPFQWCSRYTQSCLWPPASAASLWETHPIAFDTRDGSVFAAFSVPRGCLGHPQRLGVWRPIAWLPGLTGIDGEVYAEAHRRLILATPSSRRSKRRYASDYRYRHQKQRRHQLPTNG